MAAIRRSSARTRAWASAIRGRSSSSTPEPRPPSSASEGGEVGLREGSRQELEPGGTAAARRCRPLRGLGQEAQEAVRRQSVEGRRSAKRPLVEQLRFAPPPARLARRALERLRGGARRRQGPGEPRVPRASVPRTSLGPSKISCIDSVGASLEGLRERGWADPEVRPPVQGVRDAGLRALLAGLDAGVHEGGPAAEMEGHCAADVAQGGVVHRRHSSRDSPAGWTAPAR